MPATARVAVLMTPAEKRTLAARAKREDVSLGELMRRAALGSHGAEEEALRTAVTALATANAAAQTALDKVLSDMVVREREWPAREQRAIARGRALAAQWSARS